MLYSPKILPTQYDISETNFIITSKFAHSIKRDSPNEKIYLKKNLNSCSNLVYLTWFFFFSTCSIKNRNLREKKSTIYLYLPKIFIYTYGIYTTIYLFPCLYFFSSLKQPLLFCCLFRQKDLDSFHEPCF